MSVANSHPKLFTQLLISRLWSVKTYNQSSILKSILVVVFEDQKSLLCILVYTLNLINLANINKHTKFGFITLIPKKANVKATQSNRPCLV